MTHVLEVLRKHHHYTREQLAAATANTPAGVVTSRTILNVERYGRVPRRRTAEALGVVLDVDAELLRVSFHEPSDVDATTTLISDGRSRTPTSPAGAPPPRACWSTTAATTATTRAQLRDAARTYQAGIQTR